MQLVINIEDVNDNPPIFIQNKYEARLLENKEQFETTLKVEARDADLNGTKNSEIVYLLFGEYKNNFTIDPITGDIKPREPIDFEKLSGSPKLNIRTLYLTVRAKDLGTPSLHSDVELLVYVEDVNDNAPQFEHVYYNKSIAENVPSGTAILHVKATDLDGSMPNNQIAYRIQKGASDKFVIGAETGVISVAKGASLDPDLTQPRSEYYSLKVIALDGAPGENQLQAAVTVNITILDVNNKDPVLVQPRPIRVKENTPVGTVITRLEATDPDTTAKLLYKIDTNCEAKNEQGVLLKSVDYDCMGTFHLNASSGILTIAKLLDRETVESMRIGVVVEDIASNIGPQTATSKLFTNSPTNSREFILKYSSNYYDRHRRSER